MVETKRCGRCRRRLPLAEFARRSAGADGLQNYCRDCSAAWARQNRPRKLKQAPSVGSDEKWCRRCETVKAVTAFSPHKATADRLQTYCRDCFAAIYRARREAQGHVVRPAEVPEGHKFCRGCNAVLPLSAWSRRSTTKDGYAFRCRTCMAANDRAKHLARSYGLTVEDVELRLADQGGRCAICRAAAAVHVDHDHATGAVRGLLCFRCNAALGQLGDNPRVLRRAARYLENSLQPPRRAHPVIELRDRSSAARGGSRLESALRERLAGLATGTAS